MHDLRDRLARYASLSHPVLLQGESGTGKEIAGCHHLHRLTPRHAEPLLVLNCSAINPGLIEASLFGHARGAFTGAIRDQAGYFGEVGQGTLFLDEIGELPLELQGTLLRVIENGEYQRLGETRTRRTQARIITATHRELRIEVQEGRFRADLYHRLSVLKVQIPPVRKRGTDRWLLLEHFRRQFADNDQCNPFQLDAEAEKLWADYDFPGNVRELRNIVARLSAHCPGKTVDGKTLCDELEMRHATQHLPIDWPAEKHDNSPESARQLALHILHDCQSIDLDAQLAFWEQSYIRAALEMTQGNLSRAARRLGLNRTTLYNRIRSWETR